MDDAASDGIGDDDWIVRTSGGKKTKYLCANTFTVSTYQVRPWTAGVYVPESSKRTEE